MKKITLFVAVTLVLSLFLAACAPKEGTESSEQTGPAAVEEKAKIGFLSISMAPEFTNRMSEGIQTAADEFGYEYIVVDYNMDPEKEIAGIETLYNSGVRAYYTISLSAEADADKLTQYPEMGVISQGQFPFYQAAVLDDNNWIAEQFCAALDAFIQDNGITSGEIAGIWVDGTQSEDNPANAAYQIITSVINDHYAGTGFTYVSDIYPKTTEEVASAVDTSIAANPDAKFFFVYNNDMAIAAAQELQAVTADAGEYFVFSTEGSEESFRLIASETSPYKACVYADLVGTGYKTGLQLINWVENQAMENVTIERILVDKTNVSEFYTP